MPILDLQRRARELGRIRIGQVQPTSNGRTRPAKLDRFRITAASRPILDRVAELYGGQVREWTPQNSNVAAWEVLTESTRLPILVPPQPVTQWYEVWSGGGCQRRCDGVREMLADKPCICGPDPDDRVCKPTTRLNVVLREVEGIGVWRLETHGYYAAVELPMAAELLAQAGGYVSGHLGLEERSVVRAGKTNRFMVPTIDIDMTPGQLLTGGVAGQIGGEQRAVAGAEQRAALPAGQPAEPTLGSSGKPLPTFDEEQTLVGQIRDTDNLDQLRDMWRDLAAAYHLDDGRPVVQALRARAAELQPGADAPADEPAGDADDVWSRIMRAVPEDWSTTQVENDFVAVTGVAADAATAAQMTHYLDGLPARLAATA